MSRRAVKVEVNTLLKEQLGTGELPSGLMADVVFTREEQVTIPEDKQGIYSVAYGKESQLDGSPLGCPTARFMPCLIDIFGRDEETVDTLFEELKDVLAASGFAAFQAFRVEAAPLYLDNIEADGVRATVLLNYVA